MKCNYCGKGKGKNHTKDKEGKLYYYYCQECVGDYKNDVDKSFKKNIPFLDGY